MSFSNLTATELDQALLSSLPNWPGSLHRNTEQARPF
jgi:hypothetical protein